MQERALRFVYEDHTCSHEMLLEKAKMPSLHIRRQRTMAIETFNIVNKLAPLIIKCKKF